MKDEGGTRDTERGAREFLRLVAQSGPPPTQLSSSQATLDEEKDHC